MRKVALVISSILTLYSFNTFSQENQECVQISTPALQSIRSLSSEERLEQMRESFEANKEYLKMHIAMMTEKDIAEELAKFSKVYYDELIKVGFNAEQAMNLVIAVGIPRNL